MFSYQSSFITCIPPQQRNDADPGEGCSILNIPHNNQNPQKTHVNPHKTDLCLEERGERSILSMMIAGTMNGITVTATEKPVRPLPQLPSELIYLVSQFCTGSSISTLLLATSSCPQHRGLIDTRRILQDRVQLIIARTNHLASAVHIQLFLRRAMEYEEETLQFLSTRLALVDYFESGTTNKRTIEFPIWVGTLNDQSSISQASTQKWIQLSTPFWNPMLVSAYHSTMSRSFGMKVIPQHRNYRTVPPFGRIEGIRASDNIGIAKMMERMEEYGQVLAPPEFGTNTPGEVSIFLVTDSQARNRCPHYLPDHLDPYKFKEKAGSRSELYCLWMQNWEDNDDEADVEYVVGSLIFLMKRMDSIRQSAMLAVG